MKRATLLVLSLLTALAPVTIAQSADDASPVGRWQTTTGESRYEVSYCGGENLCAKLVWLRADARTPENLAFLNKYVVRGAQPVADNKWRGTVHYEGEKVQGNLTVVSDGRLRISGCKAIFCQTVNFHRI